MGIGEALILLLIVGALGLMGLVFAAITGLIIWQSVKRKGRWGVNVKRTDCPCCGWKLPAVRKPTGLRQALWGGWTCQQCGAELDKWGQEIHR